MSDTRPTNFSSVWADLRGVSFKQHFIDAAGIRTRCIESGDPSKPLVLALHGVGGHAEAYSRNFGPHADHFWFVAIDMLGHGWTDKPAIDYQVKDYADHVLAVLETLGRDKAMISGESLGGWVATYLAVHRPAGGEKLVLNTAGGWTAHPQVMERLKSLSNQAASDPSWERIKTRLEFLMCDKSMVSDDLIETRRAIYAQPGFTDTMKRIMCLQEMEIRRPNMITAEQYRSIKAPTMVVWTSHDPTATPEEGKQIADMIVAEDEPVAAERVLQPKIEAEVAFLLDRDVDVEAPTVADVLRAVAYAMPALEIVGSRISNWDIGIVDTVADNASSGLFVLGGPVRRLDGLDLRALQMQMTKREEVVSKGTGAACLGNPLNAMVWLAGGCGGRH